MTRRFRIPQLDSAPDSPFPDPARCDHPEGLVAWGGDLSTTRLAQCLSLRHFPLVRARLPDPVVVSPSRARCLFPMNGICRNDCAGRCARAIFSDQAGQRIRQGGQRLCRATARTDRHLDHSGHAASLPGAAPGRPCPQHRSLVGTGTDRWTVWRCHRQVVFRRIEISPPSRCHPRSHWQC